MENLTDRLLGKKTVSLVFPIGEGDQKVGSEYFEKTLLPFLKKEFRPKEVKK